LWGYFVGVGALVLTADDKVITMKRSANCGEAPGLYDIPGGHPEPEVEILYDSHQSAAILVTGKWQG